MSPRRLVDAETGEVVQFPGAEEIERLRGRVGELEDKLEVKDQALGFATKEASRLQGRLTALTTERRSSRREDPFWDDAVGVYDFWVSELEPRAKKFNEDRQKLVLERLHEGFTKEELHQAILGCKVKPYVVDGKFGRQAEGKPSERRTELTLICRNEENVRRFISYLPAKGASLSVVPSSSGANARIEELEGYVESLEARLLPPMTIAVPDWPVRCEKGCSHTKMLRGTWKFWQIVGMAGCPWCGYDVITPAGERSSEYRWRPVSEELFARVERGEKL